MILYRPMDLEELRLVYETGMKGFPPRKPEQPIFYPVLNLQYADEIAARWNVESGSGAGYVGEFTIDDVYGAQFQSHIVGRAYHAELWIPSEELHRFNEHISPPIRIISAHFRVNFEGYIPSGFGLRGKDASAQFVALAHALDESATDFTCEVSANHVAVFLNYAFWLHGDFSSDGIAKDNQSRVLTAIRTVWAEAFSGIILPLTRR